MRRLSRLEILLLRRGEIEFNFPPRIVTVTRIFQQKSFLRNGQRFFVVAAIHCHYRVASLVCP